MKKLTWRDKITVRKNKFEIIQKVKSQKVKFTFSEQTRERYGPEKRIE